jgi:hypothetical protein
MSNIPQIKTIQQKGMEGEVAFMRSAGVEANSPCQCTASQECESLMNVMGKSGSSRTIKNFAVGAPPSYPSVVADVITYLHIEQDRGTLSTGLADCRRPDFLIFLESNHQNEERLYQVDVKYQGKGQDGWVVNYEDVARTLETEKKLQIPAYYALYVPTTSEKWYWVPVRYIFLTWEITFLEGYRKVFKHKLATDDEQWLVQHSNHIKRAVKNYTVSNSSPTKSLLAGCGGYDRTFHSELELSQYIGFSLVFSATSPDTAQNSTIQTGAETAQASSDRERHATLVAPADMAVETATSRVQDGLNVNDNRLFKFLFKKAWNPE